MWGSVGSQSISLLISLSLLPQPNLICIFSRAIFWISCLINVLSYSLQNKIQSAYLVWYSSPSQSCFNLFCSASFASFYSGWVVLPVFPNKPCVFPPSSPWSCHFCCLECLFMQDKLKFTHLLRPPASPTFLRKTHWPPHPQNYSWELEPPLPAYC